jgi:hypothetical protein
MEERRMPPETASAELLHRRQSDPSGSDFRQRRYVEERSVIVQRGDGSLSRWTIGAVLSIGLMLFAFFAGRDRLSVDAKFSSIDVRQDSLAAQVSRHEAEIQVIRAKQDRVLADIAENGRKLDLLLFEARRK